MKKQDRDEIPECVEVKLAYDLSVIPVFGLLFFVVIYFWIRVKNGADLSCESYWLRKGWRRALIYTGASIILAFVFFASYITYLEIFTDTDPESRFTTSQQNLQVLRNAIEIYQAKTGTFPSMDMRELCKVQFTVGRKVGPILTAIPPELISKKDLRPPEMNPPNRKVHNQLGIDGGWFYNPKTGHVRLNYNKMLGSEWGSHKWEIPSLW
jgi:hypothetical protein